MIFLSTPSARRATLTFLPLMVMGFYFYPRPPRGGRPWSARRRPSTSHFYPRPPRGGRPITVPSEVLGGEFLSTPSARRATSAPTRRSSQTKISIHALREEGDSTAGRPANSRKISIHALREEGDPYWVTSIRTPTTFLSTPSARRATPAEPPLSGVPGDFYPRPPRGGRPKLQNVEYQQQKISIHALREEGDRLVLGKEVHGL